MPVYELNFVPVIPPLDSSFTGDAANDNNSTSAITTDISTDKNDYTDTNTTINTDLSTTTLNGENAIARNPITTTTTVVAAATTTVAAAGTTTTTSSQEKKRIRSNQVMPAEGDDKVVEGGVVAQVEALCRSWTNKQLKVALAERGCKTTGTR